MLIAVTLDPHFLMFSCPNCYHQWPYNVRQEWYLWKWLLQKIFWCSLGISAKHWKEVKPCLQKKKRKGKKIKRGPLVPYMTASPSLASSYHPHPVWGRGGLEPSSSGECQNGEGKAAKCWGHCWQKSYIFWRCLSSSLQLQCVARTGHLMPKLMEQTLLQYLARCDSVVE